MLWFAWIRLFIRSHSIHSIQAIRSNTLWIRSSVLGPCETCVRTLKVSLRILKVTTEFIIFACAYSSCDGSYAVIQMVNMHGSCRLGELSAVELWQFVKCDCSKNFNELKKFKCQAPFTLAFQAVCLIPHKFETFESFESNVKVECSPGDQKYSFESLILSPVKWH